LQAAIKGIVYWEKAIASCIPPYRRFNNNAISNTTHTHRFPPPTQAMQDYRNLGSSKGQYRFGTLFDKIDGMNTAESLAEYIGGHGNSRLKHLAWNFAHFGEPNTHKSPLNTIEFRRWVLSQLS
ncbi:MAG: hypothetical protein Q9191_006641, partial [Dirinaria sp. TL-2023a]